MKAQIIWTTLPNGIKGKKLETPIPHRINEKYLKISVFVSPRLIPDSDESVLRDFVKSDSWPENWTQAIKREGSLKVHISQGSQQISVEAPILNDLDEKMWDDIFPLNTSVSGYQHQDYRTKRFRSFSVREMQDSLRGIYREVADLAPNNLPKLINFKQNSVLRKFLEMGEIPDKFHTLRSKIDAECKEKDDSYSNECIRKVEPFSTIDFSGSNIRFYGARDKQELHFILGHRYYNRLEHDEKTNRVYTLEDEITAIEKDESLSDGMKREQIQKRKELALREAYSFEQLLATIGDYPAVMRKLGLIIDLEIPMAALGRRRLSDPAISIEAPDLLSAVMTHTTPETYTVINRRSSLFYARTEPGRSTYIKQREIDLEDPKDEFDLVQVDIDGATLKSIHTANSFLKVDLTPASDDLTSVIYGTSEDASLPALQSAGISLARYNRAYETQQHLEKMSVRNDQLNSNRNRKVPGFYANDLVRGYRVDVQIEGENRWYSLCQREGVYRIKDGDSFMFRDEGYVKTATLSTVDENSYYLHENMFRWDGWSLCVERPGKLIYDEVDEKNGIRPNEMDANLKGHAPLEVKFSVPMGSLPKLRFGQTYRFRVRIVDIAGNSQPLDSVCDSSLVEKYKRFEPVSPPSLTFLREPSEGESLEHMVIRSNFDKAAEETNKRHLFPPKTSQLMSETHGKFDVYMHSPQDMEKGFDIASRDAKDLLDCDNGAGRQNCEKIQINSQDTDVEDTYIVCRDDMTYTVPYLPDVYADGVALRDVPGVTFETKIKGLSICKQFGEVVLKVPFSGEWPKIETFRIEIKERKGEMESHNCEETFSDDGKPKWNQVSRVLTLFLPKGEIAKVKYSSYLNKISIENMGIADWVEGDYFKALGVCGMNWMVAPFRELTLVHAVRQPLCAPKILKFNEDKERKKRGDTFAKLEGILETNAKSTEKVAILAEWNEVIDNPDTSDEPQVQTFSSIAMELPIGYSQNNLVVKDDVENFGKHEFGDTKFRLVSYHLKATSRFREYFPSSITDDAEKITRDGERYEGIKVRIEKELVNDYGAIIELEEGDKQNVIPIYNSARPLSPKISYMIPTFGWEGPTWSNEDGVIKVTKKRKGKGLRVYLERPWFSSGDGEMLGVVLLSDCFDFDKKSDEDVDQLNIFKPYVSQWGKDPVYASDTVNIDIGPVEIEVPINRIDALSPTADKFELAKCFKRELTLEELPAKEMVDVVGHKVEYDANKKLWFSDIVINPGLAYNPFVRLGLARYQPNSINNAHLSRVVLSDFMQLLPDREFEVKFREVSKGFKKYIHVSVAFHGVSQTKLNAGNINIVISKYILDQAKIEENPHIGWMPVMSFDLVNGQGYADFEKPEISEIYKIEINEFEHIKKDSEKPTISYMAAKSPRLVYHDDILFKTDAPFKLDI